MSPFSSLRSLSVGPALILANLLGVVTAQQWAPLMMDNTGTRNVPGRSDVNPYGWGDSYSVGNTCYCDTTYDHDIDEIIVSTPVGTMTVKEACDKIGKGPGSSGRPRYNDIQCGNGPANDAGDEDDCPGRIEHGANGCKYIGPKWNFAPNPVPVPVPVPTPVASPTKTNMPLFIGAGSSSGPSFSIAGSTNIHWASWGSYPSIGAGGYDNELFRPHRWTSANSFSYIISGLVPGASYTVTMGFAETFEPNCGADKRVFSIAVNGATIVQNLDVFAAVGCKKAFVNSQTVTANGSGKLELSFVKNKQNPFVSFINVANK